MKDLWKLGGILGFAVLGATAAEPSPREQLVRYALTKEGDAAHGRELFGAEQQLACTRCHTADGSASKAGPDLLAVGDKFGRRDLIDAVLNPSATIAVGYSATTVVTKSGDEYTGVLKQATPSELGLMGGDGKLVRVALSDIVERQTSEVSLMPEGFEKGLSPQDFNDLIEYLVSLKVPEHSNLNHQGMPDAIPMLARPVVLHPMHGSELRFQHPVCLVPVPGVPGQFLVGEHETGKIWLFGTGETPTKTLFLETGPNAPGARGLIGVAFHPHFAENRRYYVLQHVGEGGQFASVISERKMKPNGCADAGQPARVILRVEAASNIDHMGEMVFGTDGYAYIGMGDTGPSEDPQGHGQSIQSLNAKLLRIDVDHASSGRNYAIPADNPFVGKSDYSPEVWATGLREPWRLSFDRVTGDLWTGDVGQDRYEEIDIVRRGENMGWNVFEGFEPFSNKYRREQEHYVPPVFAYRRKYGPCVTGGYVYRGKPESSYYGVYVFGDFESRRILGLTQENRVLKAVRQVGISPERIASFAQGEAGELYVVGYEGTMMKLDLAPSVFE